jgi:hypothetical protein
MGKVTSYPLASPLTGSEIFYCDQNNADARAIPAQFAAYMTINLAVANNTALGAGALASAQAVTYGNVAIGSGALGKITTAQASVAVGYQAFFNVTAAAAEAGIAIGSQALYSQTTSLANIGIGNTVLFNCTTGGGLNVAVGHHAFYSLTTGGGNVGLGYNAGYDHTTAAFNTLLGHNTGRGIITGSNNTVVGAQIGSLPPGLSNAIILGTGDGSILADYNYTVTGVWWLGNATATQVLTVAVLIANYPASSLLTGSRAFVSDSTVALIGNAGAIVTGGGSNRVPVHCDGTNWRLG